MVTSPLPNVVVVTTACLNLTAAQVAGWAKGFRLVTSAFPKKKKGQAFTKRKAVTNNIWAVLLNFVFGLTTP